MGDASPEREHILCLLPFPENEKVLKAIKDKHPNVDFTYRYIPFERRKELNTSSIPDDLLKEATILVTLVKLPSLDQAVNLKLIHLISAGADRILNTPIWKETEIPFTNSSGVHSPQISEWVVLQFLSHAHQQKKLLELQKKHIWGGFKDFGYVRDGVGQRLGVLGYGAIGRQTARVARSLGIDVLAYTASPRTTPESKRDRGYIVPGTGDPDGSIPSAWYSGLEKSSLHHFLSQDIDILLVSVPLTPQTRHFLGAEEFKILGRKNAFIVNIARGPIIHQDDLITALKKKPEEGGLGGAALDVTDPEPLPEDSELWDLENVAVTPHVSGLATTNIERSFEILDINLTNSEQGKPFINVVDRRKGY